jgi:hypothetical protein
MQTDISNFTLAGNQLRPLLGKWKVAQHKHCHDLTNLRGQISTRSLIQRIGSADSNDPLKQNKKLKNLLKPRFLKEQHGLGYHDPRASASLFELTTQGMSKKKHTQFYELLSIIRDIDHNELVPDIRFEELESNLVDGGNVYDHILDWVETDSELSYPDEPDYDWLSDADQRVYQFLNEDLSDSEYEELMNAQIEPLQFDVSGYYLPTSERNRQVIMDIASGDIDVEKYHHHLDYEADSQLIGNMIQGIVDEIEEEATAGPDTILDDLLELKNRIQNDSESSQSGLLQGRKAQKEHQEIMNSLFSLEDKPLQIRKADTILDDLLKLRNQPTIKAELFRSNVLQGRKAQKEHQKILNDLFSLEDVPSQRPETPRQNLLEGKIDVLIDHFKKLKNVPLPKRQIDTIITKLELEEAYDETQPDASADLIKKENEEKAIETIGRIMGPKIAHYRAQKLKGKVMSREELFDPEFLEARKLQMDNQEIDDVVDQLLDSVEFFNKQIATQTDIQSMKGWTAPVNDLFIREVRKITNRDATQRHTQTVITMQPEIPGSQIIKDQRFPFIGNEPERDVSQEPIEVRQRMPRMNEPAESSSKDVGPQGDIRYYF